MGFLLFISTVTLCAPALAIKRLVRGEVYYVSFFFAQSANVPLVAYVYGSAVRVGEKLFTTTLKAREGSENPRMVGVVTGLHAFP